LIENFTILEVPFPLCFSGEEVTERLFYKKRSIAISVGQFIYFANEFLRKGDGYFYFHAGVHFSAIVLIAFAVSSISCSVLK